MVATDCSSRTHALSSVGAFHLKRDYRDFRSNFHEKSSMPLGKFGKITLSWVAITVTSLSLFVVSKNYVNANRVENMKARERMRKSNVGEYPDMYRK
ncbi:hypothetical protein NE865_09098 [Phthorimaea operculella]|nr:hypothetical protein NE865_09098 [Phthorimaea operculella]